MTEVIALTTCGASLLLLSAFVSAIITANGWLDGVRATAERNGTIAISNSKDGYDFRTEGSTSDDRTASSVLTALSGLTGL